MIAPAPARVPLLVVALVAGVLAWAWPAELPAWRALGVASGWAGTALLVASTLLTVRMPGLARGLGGLEAMLRGHHVAGTLGYALLLLHPLALAVDDALQPGGQGWAVLAPWRQGHAVQLGWAALLLLMLGLGTTFAQRLSWRRWRAWHPVLAAAVVLGLLHVERLLGGPAAWWGLMGAVALALVLRGASLDRAWTALPFGVTDVQRPGPQVIEATLAPWAGRLVVQPGQFVLLAFGEGPGFHGCGEFHPFTVSGTDPQGRLRVAIKALGPCSSHVQRLAAGTAVRVQGPFGRFLLDDQGRPETVAGPQVWVAGGIGITPFIAALRQGLGDAPLHLLYLVREVDDAPFADELRRLAATHPGLVLRLQASDDAGADLPALLDAVPGLAQCQVRACGPAPLLQALRQALAERGVPAAACRAEQFDFR